MRQLVQFGAFVLIGAACAGVPPSTAPTSSIAPDAIAESRTSTTRRPDPSTTEPLTTHPADPVDPVDPASVEWFAPRSGIDEVAVVESERYLSADCGPNALCDPYLPASLLRYESERGDISIQIDQRLTSQLAPIPSVFGDTSSIEIHGRQFDIGVFEQSNVPVQITAVSVSPAGDVLLVSSSGLDVATVEEIVSDLAPAAPTRWPVVERSPLTALELAVLQGRCVDDDSRWVPTFIPAEYTLFVVSAQETGSCDSGPFMFMTLWRKSDDPTQPQQTNLFVRPIYGSGPGDGEQVEIDGIPARVRVGNPDDSSPPLSIRTVIGDAAISLEGTIDRENAEAVIASFELVDRSGWEAFVAAGIDGVSGLSEE